MIKKNYLFIFLIMILCTHVTAKNSIFIVTTINGNIITNFDIEKEVSYLKILNPQLEKLDEKKIFNVAKNSILNEVIKKNEVKKFFKLDKDIEMINKMYSDLYISLGFSNNLEFENILIKNNSYTTSEIIEKIKVEFFWSRIIFEKFNNQVRINEKELTQKVENIDNYKDEYLLSEIFFNKDVSLSLEDQINKITNSIDQVGFNNTASIFSKSESANFGGKIGWVEENSLSKKIIDEIKKIKIGEYTSVIQFGNNFLILKVEDKKTKKININNNQLLTKMIEFEKNKQLNQFSNIYFNKIKINYEINEK
tara:strand:+ start:534 stop:1460 length:927 start_codon:yes stop_codon:yes gene_type:complete